MKRIRALLVLLAAALTISACGREKPAPSADPAVSALRFSTVDRAGNRVDESVLAGHRVVMLHFWEPWSAPCAEEMPDLERLYRDYRDRGLLILGIYSSDGMEEEVDAALRDSGTSYPILRDSRDFDMFRTGYVPTTVFVDGEGRILSELLVGSRDYTGWEELILGALR